MSKKEIERLRNMHKVMDKRMTQVKASELLRITDRQVRNLIGKIMKKRDKSTTHENRGGKSHRKMAKRLEGQIRLIVKYEYPDFGPTWVSEKLTERDGIRVEREKLH